MRGSLKISNELSLPLDTAATQTYAFIARKGAGKTYAAGKLVELLLSHVVQVVILDTVGNWYGLRIDADGKGKGFDIPIFGGLRGDLPLQASAGELLADVVVDTGRSVILDLSQFNLADRKRFATSFGEHLWKKKKAERVPSPMMLVIEESQLIVPQFSKGSEHMLGIYEEIIRLGRNYGIGVTMISQRPQSVNKEVLNQTECLFVLQVNGTQERKALRDWVVYQGIDINLLNELPSLPIGTAYVWSPQWLGVLKKVKIAPKSTFDSSATPKIGNKTQRRNPIPLDLGEIEARMSAMVEQAKQNDPKALQQKVLELQRQLNTRPVEVKPTPVIQRVEVPVLNGEVKELSALLAKFGDYATVLREVRDTLDSVDTLLERTNLKIDSVKNYKVPIATPTRPLTIQEPHSREWHVKTNNVFNQPKADSVELEDGTGKKLREGERNMLAVLKQFHPQPLSDSKVRLLAKAKFSSKTFNTYKSVLKSKDLVSDSVDGMFLTDKGYHYAGEVESALQTTEELFTYWASRVRAGEQYILRRGVDMRGQWLGLGIVRQELPHLSDKTFDTYISVLKNNNLIEVDGVQYRASESFFMG